MSSQLKSNASDHIAAILKATLSNVPSIGSFLSELVDYVIPNQRLDRIADFAKQLDQRINDLESHAIEQEMLVSGFSDLFEDTLHQVVRAGSVERRGYLASFLVRTLTEHQVTFEEARHLLRLLGELTDIEVIWLGFYCGNMFPGHHNFIELHADILDPVIATYGSSDQTKSAQALQHSYRDHLIRLGLVEQEFVTNVQGEPVFEAVRREFKKG